MHTKTESPWSVATSVLVYATAPDAPAQKQRVAQDLLERLFLGSQGCLAGQVLTEYLNLVLTKKTMSHALALEAVSIWSQAARVLDASGQAYEHAWKLAARHNYPVWDALLIAICAEHDIKTLYGEIAGPLSRPLGVHVINPFADMHMA